VVWPAVTWPAVVWPAVTWPAVTWPAVVWPAVTWPAVVWPAVLEGMSDVSPGAAVRSDGFAVVDPSSTGPAVWSGDWPATEAGTDPTTAAGSGVAGVEEEAGVADVGGDDDGSFVVCAWSD
jgi:hypothetical protein